MQRPLARLRVTRFGPDGRIELVFDLQHVRVDLHPFAVALRAHGFVLPDTAG